MEIPPHQLATAALEYANSVFGGTDDPGDADGAEDEVLDTADTAQSPDFPAAPPVEPYTGPIHLCLDFGTAMSKAFAWDKDADMPMPLRIGHAAGSPRLPLTRSIHRSSSIAMGASSSDKQPSISRRRQTPSATKRSSPSRTF